MEEKGGRTEKMNIQQKCLDVTGGNDMSADYGV